MFLHQQNHLCHLAAGCNELLPCALRPQQNPEQKTNTTLLFLGEIPDLFPDDEVENIINSVRNEVKGRGLVDSKEACWKFFIERVRRQLKVRCLEGVCVLTIELAAGTQHGDPLDCLWGGQTAA